MELPPFILFEPVPGRARHDGWTPELQRRFILMLAHGLRPGEAARRIGKTRSTAYALRSRTGGESFAAAWDAALRFVRDARAKQRSQPAQSPRPPAAPTDLGGAEAFLDRLASRGRQSGRS